MSPHRRHRILLTLTLLVSAAGAIDAAIGSVWDLFIALVAIVIITTVALVGTVSHRVDVTLRSDLHRALEQQSALEGEPVEVLLDRAVAIDVRSRR